MEPKIQKMVLRPRKNPPTVPATNPKKRSNIVIKSESTNNSTEEANNDICIKAEDSVVDNPPTKIKTRYSCPTCFKSFSTKNYVRLHIKDKHIEHEPFQCEICLKKNNEIKTYVSMKHLKEHIKRVHKDKEFECKHCQMRFGEKKSLVRHLISKHQTEESLNSFKVHKCEFCVKVFVNTSELEMHILDTHVQDKSLRCQTCFKMFVDQSHLSYHLKRYHKNIQSVQRSIEPVQNSIEPIQKIVENVPREITPLRYVCDVCSNEFTNRRSLLQHIGVRHNRFFFCSLCLRSFGTKTDFAEHAKKITTSAQLQCQICLKSFNTLCSFSVHTESHLQSLKPKDEYPCEKLPQIEDASKLKLSDPIPSSSSSSSLVKAEFASALEKQNNSSTQFKCRFCPKSDALRSAIVRHENTHVGKLKKVTRHECKHCQKSFISPLTLKLHVANYHGGEKPFKCHLCNQAYVFKSQLDQHLGTHLDEKPVICDEYE